MHFCQILGLMGIPIPAQRIEGYFSTAFGWRTSYLGNRCTLDCCPSDCLELLDYCAALQSIYCSLVDLPTRIYFSSNFLTQILELLLLVISLAP